MHSPFSLPVRFPCPFGSRNLMAACDFVLIGAFNRITIKTTTRFLSYPNHSTASPTLVFFTKLDLLLPTAHRQARWVQNRFPDALRSLRIPDHAIQSLQCTCFPSLCQRLSSRIPRQIRHHIFRRNPHILPNPWRAHRPPETPFLRPFRQTWKMSIICSADRLLWLHNVPENISMNPTVSLPSPSDRSLFPSWMPKCSLNFANFYCHFIEDFSRVTHLLRKSQKFVRSNDAQTAFDKLRQQFISAAILRHFNLEIPSYFSMTIQISPSRALFANPTGHRSRPSCHFSVSKL